MPEYISIHLNNGESQLFATNPTNVEINKDKPIIIKFKKDDSYYEDCAEILETVEEIPEDIQTDITEIEILRVATPHDEQIIENHIANAREATKTAIDLVNKHKLDMKIIEAKISHDNKVITLVFTAEERVDFRELLKDLAKAFKKQIRLRQIGPRDHAKIIGGYGKCGRMQCCTSYLSDLGGITMEMARIQDITSKGASKISGNCGKLLCCLSYELEVYKKLREGLPKLGTIVKTPQGQGQITDIEILKQMAKVSFPKSGKKSDDGNISDHEFAYYPIKDIKPIK